MNVRTWHCTYTHTVEEPVDNPATPDVDLDDLDDQGEDDATEVEDVDLDAEPDDDDGDGLPAGPAPDDDDWSDLGDTYDVGTALPDDTHPMAD